MFSSPASPFLIFTVDTNFSCLCMSCGGSTSWTFVVDWNHPGKSVWSVRPWTHQTYSVAFPVGLGRRRQYCLSHAQNEILSGHQLQLMHWHQRLNWLQNVLSFRWCVQTLRPLQESSQCESRLSSQQSTFCPAEVSESRPPWCHHHRFFPFSFLLKQYYNDLKIFC